MGNYHHFYLKADVLILPDVFEKFIDTCSEYYRLDLYDYVSSFRLSWDAILKITEIELELISTLIWIVYWERNDRRYFLHCKKKQYSK